MTTNTPTNQDKAKNSSAALKAVAEAAAEHLRLGNCEEGYHEETSCPVCEAKEELQRALANLNALRNTKE